MKVARVHALTAWPSLEAAVLAAIFLNKFDGRLFHVSCFMLESLALRSGGAVLVY